MKLLGVTLQHPRYRHTYMFIGPILVIALYICIDPRAHLIQDLPFGASTVVIIAELLKTLLYVTFIHASVFAIYDYVDVAALFEKAEASPTGAAIALLSMAMTSIAVAIAIAAAVLSN